MKAKAWQEDVVIPTYEIGKPEKNPVFIEKRVYQGSSGSVYPYPVIEKISDEKVDKIWHAVYLENDYLKIMILPQLGGRVQMAYDKMKQRHFVYYNQVIKPALVGLTGPWISGGIEFNWPQHHRPSTYEPTDFSIEENKDGSVTVWCSEVERMFHTKGMAGFTLHPDKAYLEIKVKLYNRTEVPQTFLWWANPAVKVNDDYQSVFPPDVNAVFDHGKRDVSSFPIATGTYYKIDYSPGTDISRYKNIPVPTSYMAITSKYDFVGGYENDSKGGLLHVANHHVSPGKKQWTWGNGEFGKAWDRNLTDEDGPYIELMCGVYTDNQPDFTWLMPGEEKSFSQYFMPYRDVGVVKNANKEALLNLEIENGVADIKAYTTAIYKKAKVILSSGSNIFFSEEFDFHPGASFIKRVDLPKNISSDDVKVEIKTADNRTLISWQQEKAGKKEIPDPAKAAKEPKEIQSNEQLFLTGQHIEQYRHATYDPRPYYQEALERDPKDYRCNNALGLWYMKKGQFAVAQKYFETAIETLTERNPNPYDGEPFFNLGLAHIYQGNPDEAYNRFHKSVWNAAYMDSGYFQVARIDCQCGDYVLALENITRSMERNWNNHKARHLKVAVLRTMGMTSEAMQLCEGSLEKDNFNYGVLFEKFLLGDVSALELMKLRMRKNMHTYCEYALDYMWAGMFKEAVDLIDTGISEQESDNSFPLANYYKAWCQHKCGKTEKAQLTLKESQTLNPDFCFPNQPEAVMVLQWATNQNPVDYKALFYLGNYWFAHKNYNEAIQCWEKSRSINNTFPTVHRNLSLVYFNKKGDADKALKSIEKAFQLDETDGRVFMEMDQLSKRLGHPMESRRERMENYIDIVKDRDDQYLELINVYNHTGLHQKAYDMLLSRIFHPWEGGEGKVTGQYVLSLTIMAREAILAKDYQRAVEYLEKAQTYPENLGEGKLQGCQENELFYLLGLAYEGLNEKEKSVNAFKKAATGLDKVSVAMFYNDQNPETIFYQGMALLKLNNKEAAGERFVKLVVFGEKHMDDKVKMDYFAVSFPDLLIWDDDLTYRNHLHCKYLMGLGMLGMGKTKETLAAFNEILGKDIYHTGAHFQVKMIEKGLYD